MEKFFGKLIKSAQSLKKEIKITKGLNVDEEFVMVNVHSCEFCGKKFSKPCSLGGHISKLHTEERQERRREIKLEEFKERLVSRSGRRQWANTEHYLSFAQHRINKTNDVCAYIYCKKYLKKRLLIYKKIQDVKLKSWLRDQCLSIHHLKFCLELNYVLIYNIIINFLKFTFIN